MNFNFLKNAAVTTLIAVIGIMILRKTPAAPYVDKALRG